MSKIRSFTSKYLYRLLGRCLLVCWTHFFQFDTKLDTFILKNDSLSPKRMIICSQKGNIFPINDNLFPYLWQQSTSSNYIFLLMNLVCNLKAIVLSNFSFIAQLLRLEVFLVNHLHTYLIFAIFLFVFRFR